MHLVTVAPSIPNPATGGGGNWSSSLIRYFAQAGHQVTHIAVIGKYAPLITVDDQARAAYRRLGVEVIVIPHRKAVSQPRGWGSSVRILMRPSLADIWANDYATRPLVIEAIERIKPDCVLPFAFDAVLYTHGLTVAPRMGVQAEGPHINTYVNWRYSPLVEPGISLAYLRYSLRAFLLQILQERLYAEVTRGLTIAAFQGPHYVNWAKRRGLSNAVFATTPTPDPAGPQWREMRAAAPRNPKCRILMIGHLYSTSNRSGLPIFFHEILPTLEAEWGIGNFEIHIVGRDDMMPKQFDAWRQHPALVFRGPVYPADHEFLTADVLLVPVPARTGSRVRIINGFSYGCCIVAHTANALGIPELKHNENVLMADTGRGIAHQVIRAAKDPDLRRHLGENGRNVYEQAYTEAVGGEQYVRLVERAVALFEKT